MFLTTRGLLVGYRGRAILPPIDVTVRRGDFWAVVGVNGSGKTTLLRTLLGLLPRVGGQIEWNEETVLSYVAQWSDFDASVPSRVRDFVRAGLDRGWSFLRWGHRDPDSVQEALAEAKCDRLADEQFSSLSEGQKGRVRLARALVSSPNVLVLDEPTSAVDSVTEAAIFDTLDELRRVRGVTLLVISHRTHVFVGRATHAIFVDRDDGAAVTGTFEEVVRAPPFLSRHGPIGSYGFARPDAPRTGR
ncbi:MAG TPA: ATP-binding cassette domain-containing protein [Vicinamibacteria bacterium]|nr:ATP-binding cassette domain-containing protein [Vicinamibacteria bacterium]